jgi:hypothetical protein
VVQGTIAGFWAAQYCSQFRWVGAALLEFGFTAYFSLCLLQVQRKIWGAAPLLGIALLAVPAIAMAKYQYLTAQATFADLFSLGDLVRHYGFYGWIGAGCGLILIALGSLLFCWNWQRPSAVGFVLWAPATAFWLLIAAKLFLPWSYAQALPSPTPLKPGNVSLPLQVLDGNWGSFMRSAYVYADRRAISARLRSAADPDFGFMGTSLKDAERRNVYFIVLESFMDPTAIEGSAYNVDPFGGLMREWRDKGALTAMSPVFGNRSADAEFEALCGLPVTMEGAPVVFPQVHPSELDCLPRKLARLGWLTEAHTITDPHVYNYGKVYPKLGFTDLYFADSLKTDDIDGSQMPSATATLSDNLRHIGDLAYAERPYFNYVFGAFGHFPYPLDTRRRPYVVTSNASSSDVQAYINSVYYSALALDRYVDAVRARDPDALIVAFGDHRPVLRDSQSPIEYPGGPLHRQDVPLLIIDGARGVVPLRGPVPLYHLPGIVTDLLTNGKYCEQNRCQHREGSAMRPLPERLILIDRQSGEMTDCSTRTIDARCETAERQSTQFQSALITLIGDQ